MSGQSTHEPRIDEHSHYPYRAPPSLVVAEGYQSFHVGRLTVRWRKNEKLQILVQCKVNPQSFDSWELVDALRVDVPGCRLRARTPAAPAPLGPNGLAEAAYREEVCGILPPTSLRALSSSN